MLNECKKISVYAADVSSLNNNRIFDSLYGAVSEIRRKKTDSMKLQKDKCLSLGVEYLLMCACKDFGIDYSKELLIEDEYSKPCFPNSGIRFNLSHSEERALCVMSSFSVGCDVERVHPVNLKLADRFFSKEESDQIARCKSEQEKTEMFFRLWTLKESFIKCTGQGLRLSLDSFSVLTSGAGIFLKQDYDDSDYSLFEFNINDGYRYACCIKDYDSGVNCLPPEIRWRSIDIGLL